MLRHQHDAETDRRQMLDMLLALAEMPQPKPRAGFRTEIAQFCRRLATASYQQGFTVEHLQRDGLEGGQAMAAAERDTIGFLEQRPRVQAVRQLAGLGEEGKIDLSL